MPATVSTDIKPLSTALRRIRATDPFRGWDPTYFRVTKIMPQVQPDGSLLINEGRGTRRGWGCPYCAATISWLRRDVIQIDVKWGHKYAGDTQSYYFLYTSKTKSWERRTARTSLIKELLNPVYVRPFSLTVDPEPEALETELDLI